MEIKKIIVKEFMTPWQTYVVIYQVGPVFGVEDYNDSEGPHDVGNQTWWSELVRAEEAFEKLVAKFK